MRTQFNEEVLLLFIKDFTSIKSLFKYHIVDNIFLLIIFIYSFINIGLFLEFKLKVHNYIFT